MDRKRCQWAITHPLNTQYHDEEWCIPCFDEQKLFEFLILEGMQAGLSWLTVLKKREHYRIALDEFNPEKIARYTARKEQELLTNPNIIRNKLKIKSIMQNARAFLKLREEEGSFANFLWDFVEGMPIKNKWTHSLEMPAHTPLSDQLSKTLKKRGFNFVGSTICYSYMQAVGLIDDHIVSCFCYDRK